MRRLATKTAWAAAALLAVAAPVAAGPIPSQGWSLSSEYGGMEGTERNNRLYGVSIYTFLDTLSPRTPAVNTGPATVGVYAVESGGNTEGYRDEELQSTVFDTSVLLTDQRSGQKAVVHFAISFDNAGPYYNSVEPVFLGSPTRSVNVGGTVYTVTERLDPTATGYTDVTDVFDGNLVADVKMAQTPEPCTLGLAGVGLAGVAVGRRRRRAAAPAPDGLV